MHGRSLIGTLQSTETCRGILPYTNLTQNSNIYIALKYRVREVLWMIAHRIKFSISLEITSFSTFDSKLM